MLQFESPLVLLGLPAVLAVLWYLKKRGRPETVPYSSLQGLEKLGVRRDMRSTLLSGIRISALVLLILGAARPRTVLSHVEVSTPAVDIMLAIDCSTSMLAEDFQKGQSRISRIDIVKEAVREFIKKREYDRIGLIVFAGRAYLQCPLTSDHDVLLELLDTIEAGMLEDGTAIGSAVAVCVQRLADSEAKSKIICLLTDGRNNAGSIDPLKAARTAEAFGIKLYTVGAGSRGPVPFPARDIFGNKVYRRVTIDIDDKLLKDMAESTGGEYFRAEDTESLKEVYKQIDSMEKTDIKQKKYREYRELFPWFTVPALMGLLLGMVLSMTVWRILP